MSLEHNLPQANALARPTEALDVDFVDPPDEAVNSADTTVERLTLRIGDLCLLCDTDLGREVIPPPATTLLPHTPDWLQGVASVRGALMPVIDPARLFGVDRHPEHRTYLLVSGAGDDAVGLLVDGLPALQRFENGERLDSVPPHPVALDGHVRAAYHHAGVVWLDVELRGVFTMLGERINRFIPAG